MYLKRHSNLSKDLESKSILLLGPRQTGKSSFIKNEVKNLSNYNLLLPETFNKLNFNPQSLVDEIVDPKKIIFIDEIQKIPSLLDVVHYLIEERKIRFLLTGSSARKLKGAKINLLGGRLRMRSFNPLTYQEITEKHFNLKKALSTGFLPAHYFSDDIESDLQSYIGSYLQNEIASEGATRNVPAFSRFLEVAALSHSKQINFTNISNDAQVPRTTIHEYFQILKDTLIAYEVLPWKESVKRKSVSTSKFYFFDWGVVRKLQKIKNVEIGSPLFGIAFESFIFQELKAYIDYNKYEPLTYFRTTLHEEVDFIVNNEIAVEVKAKKTITKKDLSSLVKLHEEKKLKYYVLVYTGDKPLKIEGLPKEFKILPWKEFLTWIWSL